MAFARSRFHEFSRSLHWAAVRRPLLVLLVGLPGTGKSRLARRLGAALQAQVVESDRVRKQLFAEPRYTGGEHAAVYGWCHTMLRSALVVGRSVVFDATNLEERVRAPGDRVGDVPTVARAGTDAAAGRTARPSRPV
jgi:predicted kinase